jgi:hypothetical protein
MDDNMVLEIGKQYTLTNGNESIIVTMNGDDQFVKDKNTVIEGVLDYNNKKYTTTADDGTETVWNIKPVGKTVSEVVADPPSVGGRRRRKTAKGGRKSKKCGWGGKKSKKQKGGKRKSQKKGGKRQKQQQDNEM